MNTVVKSAERVLRTFEYFAERQQPVKVNEVSRDLAIPQSSASQLLHTLVKLGYLHYDRAQRSFAPTLRVSVLGSWLVQQENDSQSPLRMMQIVRRITGDAVALGLQNNIHALYISVLAATGPSGFYMKPGSLRPLCRSAIGLALLLDKTNDEIDLLVRRINAEANPQEGRDDANSVIRTLDESRRLGYVVTRGTATPDAGVVAVPLPSVEAQPRMAIGIGAPLTRIEKYADSYGRLLRDITTNNWQPAHSYNFS